MRILKPNRSYKGHEKLVYRDESTYPYQRSIGYREYAYLDGTLGIAFEVADEADSQPLSEWLLGVNYLGKRGGFVQLIEPPTLMEHMPAGFIAVTGEMPDKVPIPSVMQQLDTCDESLTFKRVNVYDSSRSAAVTLGKHRVLKHVVLPYEVVASSRGYTWYRLTENPS